MSKTLRINKYLSLKGLCSRREADNFVSKGFVEINGRRAKLGDKVDADSDMVKLLPRAKELQKSMLSILYHKPLGIVSSQPENGHTPAISLLTHDNRHGRSLSEREPRELKNLSVAGRLDINTTGLLVFTQSGSVAQQIIGERSIMEKEYLVRTDQVPSLDRLAELLEGVRSKEGDLLSAKSAELLPGDHLRLVLTTGKKHQVRSMMAAIGLQVTQLKRVRIGNIPLGNLPKGKWRYLLPHESFV